MAALSRSIGRVMLRASTSPAAIIAASSPAMTSAKRVRSAAAAARVASAAPSVDRSMAVCAASARSTRAEKRSSTWAISGMAISRSMAAIWVICSTAPA